MQYLIFVEFFKSTNKLSEKGHSLVLLQLLSCFKICTESATIAVLVNHIKIVGTSEGFDESDDVLIGGHQVENFDLVLEALLEFGCLFEHLFWDYFDGDGLVCFDVEGFEYFAECTRSELLLDEVVLDDFAHS